VIANSSCRVDAGREAVLSRTGAAWIDAKKAALRMGVTERAVRALCAEQWQGRGLARFERPAAGGKASWLIHQDADPRLAKIKWPEQMVADTRGLREGQHASLYQRIAVYHEWENACGEAVRSGQTVEQATASFLARLPADRGITITKATLYRWRAAYRSGGAELLKDGRWDKAGKAANDDPMLAEAARLFLSDNRLKALLCWELAAKKAREQGWTVWSYRKTALHLRETLPEADRIRRRFGKNAFTDQAEAYIEGDYSTLASNGLWNADHHLCDVMCKIGERLNKATGEMVPVHGRPWLTAWQDCASRRIVGHAIRAADPDTDVILLTLRRGILEAGVPEAAKVDCGKDFDSCQRRSENAVNPPV